MIKNLVFILFIFSLTSITYSNHYDNSFHFDDFHTIVNNPNVRDISNIKKFFVDSTTFSVLPANRSYRPLLSTTLALDYYLGNSYDPFFFHLSTFLLFLLQILLMYFLYKKLLEAVGYTSYLDLISFFATAIYALHPVSAETVNYIIQRADLHSTLGVVFGLLIYSAFKRLRKFQIYLIPVILGALSKPPSIMFAPILCAYIYLIEYQADLRFWTKSNFKFLVNSILRSTPTFIVCASLYVLQDKLTAHTWQAGGTSTLNYVLTQPYIWLYYFKSFFIPNELNADSDFPILFDHFGLTAVTGYTFVFLMLYYAYCQSFSKQNRLNTFLVFFWIFALLPTTLVPLAEVANDHRMFFPYVALSLLITNMFFQKWLELRNLVREKTSYNSISILISSLLLLVLAFWTYQRNEVWHSEESLWKEVTEKSPKNGRGLMNYGLTLMAKADNLKALDYFEKAKVLNPNYYTLEINLGIVKNLLNRNAEAEAHYKRAIQLNPGDPQVYSYYANFLQSSSRLSEAEAVLLQALKQDNTNLEARHILLKVYDLLNQVDKLNALKNTTLAIYPNDKYTLDYKAGNHKSSAEDYLERALITFNQRNYTLALELLAKALEINPEYAEAYNNQSAANMELKQWDKAVESATLALKYKPDFQLAKNNLEYAKRQLLTSETAPK